VPHPKRDLHPKTVRSIYKQAGLKEPREQTTGYIALVHKDKGTSYGVSFPDVPGCISAGDTFEEALDNASQALAGHLAVMAADGDPIPGARGLEELKRDAEFVDDSMDAVVTFVVPQADHVTTLQPAS
jgi:predicted RNase H-like HicB family nuclease